MRMINRMRGDKRWKTLPHFRAVKPTLHKMDPSAVDEMMHSANWTRVAFFRDPAERLLSAYLDKFVQNDVYSLREFNSKKVHVWARDVQCVTSVVCCVLYAHECVARGGVRRDSLSRSS